MVGATLACALAKGGLRIGIVEAYEPRPFDSENDYELRVSAISPGSEKILAALQVWPLIEQSRFCAYRQMYVWDAAGWGEIHFDAAEIGESHLGHIIENRVIQGALVERLRSFENITMFCPDSVQAIDVGVDSVEVVLAGGARLESKLIVGADGFNSRIRSLSGIGFQVHSYTQDAVVANVSTEFSNSGIAWQRFLPSGPLAFLPLANGNSSIVWSTTRDQAKQLLKVGDDRFCEMLSEAFDFKLGRIESTSPRASFPLRGGQAETYVVPRIALIGDAAHSIHPLAGQGVNLGFKDAATLADVLLESRHDIGSLRILRRYQRARLGDNVITMRAMEGFNDLFANDMVPMALLRNTGLLITNAASPVKRYLMRRAMGIIGERPSLMR
jgi:2-octaprenylphenol hydroxylase